MVVVLQRFVLGLNHSKLQNIDEKDMITSNFLAFWKLNTPMVVVRVVICSKLEGGPTRKNYFVKPEVKRMDRQHEKNYPSP